MLEYRMKFLNLKRRKQRTPTLDRVTKDALISDLVN